MKSFFKNSRLRSWVVWFVALGCWTGNLPAQETVSLLDGKLKLSLPKQFVSDKQPPTGQEIAKFSATKGGAWGAVTRGTRGLKPEGLARYRDQKVDEFSKGLPGITWLKKEIVKVRGREWADLRFAAIPAGVKDYRDGIVYTRFFSTSYKGQLLEINFTSNLERSREIKEQIDGIIESVILDEAASSGIKPPATSAPHSTELPAPIDETLDFFDIERQKFALAGKIVRVEITGKAISADPLGGKLVRVMVKDTAEHYGLVEFPRAGLEKLGISASYAGKPVALYLLITPQGAKPTAKATAVGSRFTHGSDGTGSYEW